MLLIRAEITNILGGKNDKTKLYFSRNHFKHLKVIKKNSSLFSVDNPVAGKKELIFSKC